MSEHEGEREIALRLKSALHLERLKLDAWQRASRLERSFSKKQMERSRRQKAGRSKLRKLILARMPVGISKTARNEHRKLLATFMNSIGIALAVTSFAAPLFALAAKRIEKYGIAYLYHWPSKTEWIDAFPVIAVGALGIFAGTLLHHIATLHLDEMED